MPARTAWQLDSALHKQTIRARLGLPLWWRRLEGGALEVTLAAPCRARGEVGDPQSQPFSRGVPAQVRTMTALLPACADRARLSFWEIAETPAFQAAIERKESRGAHYRADFPESRPEFEKHSYVARGNAVTFR